MVGYIRFLPARHPLTLKICWSLKRVAVIQSCRRSSKNWYFSQIPATHCTHLGSSTLFPADRLCPVETSAKLPSQICIYFPLALQSQKLHNNGWSQNLSAGQRDFRPHYYLSAGQRDFRPHYYAHTNYVTIIVPSQSCHLSFLHHP